MITIDCGCNESNEEKNSVYVKGFVMRTQRTKYIVDEKDSFNYDNMSNINIPT